MLFDKENDDWQESPGKIFRRFFFIGIAIAVLLLLSIVPLNIGSFNEIRPSLLLIAIYYWAIMRPNTLPPLPTFFTGLFFDLLTGYPLGLTALTLISVQWLTKSQRRFLLGQSFMVIWAGFGFVALGAGALQWILFSLFHFNLMSIPPLLMSTVFTVLSFPIAILPLAALNKMLEDRPPAL